VSESRAAGRVCLLATPLDGSNVSKDSDDPPTRVSAARERSHAAHERAEATHRRAAELHERAAAFQQQHAIAERKLGNVEKAQRMEALSHRDTRRRETNAGALSGPSGPGQLGQSFRSRECG